MARYSRRRGPASDFELTDSLALIPGFVIDRQFGNGTLLISGQLLVLNSTAVAGSVELAVLIDGAQINPVNLRLNYRKDENAVLGFNFLQPVSPGFHSVELQAFGVLPGGDVVVAGGAEFVVVELPEWDTDGDLVTL